MISGPRDFRFDKDFSPRISGHRDFRNTGIWSHRFPPRFRAFTDFLQFMRFPHTDLGLRDFQTYVIGSRFPVQWISSPSISGPRIGPTRFQVPRIGPIDRPTISQTRFPGAHIDFPKHDFRAHAIGPCDFGPRDFAGPTISGCMTMSGGLTDFPGVHGFVGPMWISRGRRLDHRGFPSS